MLFDEGVKESINDFYDSKSKLEKLITRYQGWKMVNTCSGY